MVVLGGKMAEPKLGTSSDGKPMHYTVGAVIEKNRKYLLIDRALPPFGWAGIAGHIGDNENPANAILRKIKEEVGLDVITKKLIFKEEVPWNTCRVKVDCHYWWLYECKTKGEVSIDPEGAKSYKWASKKEISKLKLEPVWDYWFKKLHIIK